MNATKNALVRNNSTLAYNASQPGAHGVYGANVTVLDSKILSSGQFAILNAYDAFLGVSPTIRNAYADGVSVGEGGTARVERSELDDNLRDGVNASTGTAIVLNSTVTYNGEFGVRAIDATITDSRVSYNGGNTIASAENGYGAYITNSGVITDSYFIGNTVNGVRMTGADALVIKQSVIAESGASGLVAPNANVTVENGSTIKNGRYGVYAKSATIVDSKITDNSADGVYANGDVAVSGNSRISLNLGSGIRSTASSARAALRRRTRRSSAISSTVLTRAGWSNWSAATSTTTPGSASRRKARL